MSWLFSRKGKKFFGLLHSPGVARSVPFLFPALFTQLRAAQVTLEKGSSGLEAQFLATGSELEGLARFANQFVKQVEKLVGLATGKECDSSVFSSAIGLIEQSTHFFVGCQEETCRMLGLLRNYNTQIENLLRVENELHRTMMPLKFVQTLFKSESAPLGPEVQQMFGALTQEIEGLHTQVREIFGTKFKQLEETRRTIGIVIVQLERQANSLQQVTTTHKARIESSLETLKKELIANQERDVRLGRLSKDLAREVEQVVMGLQFQDIVSQKLQHVTAALPQIEAKFTEFASASGAAASEPLQYLHQSCRLEAGQLLAAQEELAKAEAAIQGGIRSVIAHLTEMDSQCLSLDEFKLLTTSFGGMVQVLLETIEEVRDLVAATVAGAAEVYKLLRPLGGLASNLTAVVRGMSCQIHLIGLNAQVQAARAASNSQGAGLEVLSARTSEISQETNRISELAAVQLDQLGGGLAVCVAAFGQLRADGLAQQDVLNQQGLTEEKQLHAFRDSALQTLREIGSSLDAIGEQARRTLASVQFTEFHQVTLAALHTPLAAIGDAAEGWLKAQGYGVAQTSLMDSSKAGYTMKSEREVFAEVMSVGRALDGIPSPKPTAAAVSEIELFTDSPADSDNGRLIQDVQGPEVAHAVHASVAQESDLGANVELF